MKTTLISLAAVTALLASCTHRSKTTAPSDLKGCAIQFEPTEIEVRPNPGMDNHWSKWIGNGVRVEIPRKPQANVRYTPLTDNKAELYYQNLGKEEGQRYSLNMVLEFTSPTKGFARGTAQDFESMMRYKKVPFTVER